MPAAGLAVLAVAVTVVVFAGFAVAWRVRDRADRAAAARLETMELDLYHAVFTGSGHLSLIEAAAAALVHDGQIRIGEDGLVTVTATGVPPDHAVETALLDIVRGAGQPVSLRAIQTDVCTDERITGFLSGQDARVPRWAQREDDGLMTAAIWLGLLAPFTYPAAFLLPPGDVPGGPGTALAGILCFGLMGAVPLGYSVLMYWPMRRDHFREWCVRLPEHPAVTGLDDEQRGRLRESLHRQEAGGDRVES
jgi:hypothetical protein